MGNGAHVRSRLLGATVLAFATVTACSSDHEQRAFCASALELLDPSRDIEPSELLQVRLGGLSDEEVRQWKSAVQHYVEDRSANGWTTAPIVGFANKACSVDLAVFFAVP